MGLITLVLFGCDRGNGPVGPEDLGTEPSRGLTGRTMTPDALVIELRTSPRDERSGGQTAPIGSGPFTITLSTGAAPAAESAATDRTPGTGPAPIASAAARHAGPASEPITLTTPGTPRPAAALRSTSVAQNSIASADIEVVKTASVSQARVGVAFDYTIVVRNNGPDPAASVTAHDLLPASLDFVTGAVTGPPGASCILAGPAPFDMNCSFGSMASGDEFTITLTMRPTTPGATTNTATATSTTDDPVPGNNSSSVNVLVEAAEADIEVVKTASVSQARVGVAFNYTIVVRNNGPDPAASVTAHDLLPASLDFVTGAVTGPPGASCILAGPAPFDMNCSFGNMASGDEFTITLTMRPTAPGPTTNTATATSTTGDPVPGNNSSSVNVLVEAAEADVEVVKTASVSQFDVAAAFDYTIVVRNNGPDPAASVTAHDLLPASLDFVTGAVIGPPGASCILTGPAPFDMNCSFGNVASGDEFTITLTMRPTAPGPTTNTATATSATDDPVPANNTSSVDVLVSGVGADEGCGPGYWKNNPSAWAATGYSPGQTIGSVFANSGRATTSLANGLQLQGGNTLQGARDILLRAAIAALLNASHPGVQFPLTPAQVVARVDDVLATGTRPAILALAGALEADNDLGCPLH